MINTTRTPPEFGDPNDVLFSRIADDIRTKGYSVNPEALPENLGEKLYQLLGSMAKKQAFNKSSIGRDQQLIQKGTVRGDETCWITDESAAGREWLGWMHDLQVFLNRRLFLGLFSFESHFSHYRAGGFYKRHLDAFQGEDNRVLSTVLYLNHNWESKHGGELILFNGKQDLEGINVKPNFGTVVLFLSEEFPHEVVATHNDRYSVAGWFCLNTSTSKKIDPPS